MQAKILVTGATGSTGAEVIRQLLAMGEPLRALVHHQRSGLKVAAELEIVVGEYDNPATMKPAFVGIEKVYAVTPVDPKSVEWMQCLINTAVDAGVKHLVKLSAMNASTRSAVTLLRNHGITDENLRSSGLSFTIIQPSTFMQNVFWSIDTIKAQGALYQPVADTRQSMVDIVDVAAVVVKALTEPGHENNSYLLTGPAALSYNEVASDIAAAIGKPVQYIAVPAEVAKQSMLNMGMSPWLVQSLLELSAEVATGNFATISEDIQRLLGRPPNNFKDFIARYAALFHS